MVGVDSSTIELSEAQKNILFELINRHDRGHSGPVKGKDIATALDRNPGTIRTQMQSLKSLQLVNGIPGPKGGYEPTTRAYEVVDLERSDEFVPVSLRQNGDSIEGVTVTELDFINLHHPDRREAEVYFQGSPRQFEEGDAITIGPIPISGLVIDGVVDGVDTSENVCVISTDEMRFENAGE